MTELERRALMGGKEAQEECTEKGIVLPCPCCGNTKVALIDELEVTVWFRCTLCGCLSRAEKDERVALQNWNTRTLPPIGRCETCDWWGDAKGPMLCLFTVAGQYCSEYKSKEES